MRPGPHQRAIGRFRKKTADRRELYPILSELEDAQAAVANLRAEMSRVAGELKIAEARLDAFEIAARAFEAAAPKASRPPNGKRKSNRLPNSDWQRVFQLLHSDYGNDFGYDEIVAAASTIGIDDVKKPSLRTKMMNYADGGYVERKDAGRFAITPKGIPYFKIGIPPIPKENEPRSENAGGSDTGWGSAATPTRPWNQPSEKTADW